MKLLYFMNAAIITIGDEILIGQIIDTNSAWLAEQLNMLGIKVDEIISISDSPDHIKASLRNYEGKKDIVLITGGLGPTRDDLTKKTLADYFNSELQMNQEVLAHIENLFPARGMKVLEINRLQAMLPLNCTILHNPSGTAAGMWFERSETVFVSMPGVPYELMDIFNHSLKKLIIKRIKGSTLLHRTLMTQGVPESVLSDRLKDWEAALPVNVKLAYLPRPGIVRLRLTATGDNISQIKETLEEQTRKILEIIGDDVYCLEDQPLERVVGELLKKTGKHLAVAESCTGGAISRLITSIPGSSQYYKGGITAYSNDVKTALLGIDKALISQHGAVSREVAEAMAYGIRKLLSVDYSIAVTGIAGPEGGSVEKPVGTTWIAVSSPEKTFSKGFSFGEHRGRNIEKASLAALNMLRKLILGKL